MQSVTGNVLIVDNEAEERESYEKILKRALPHLNVRSVSNGTEALTAWGKCRYDLAVVDMYLSGPPGGAQGEGPGAMPREDDIGYETILDLRNGSPDSEVIAFTYSPNPYQSTRCHRAGCAYFDKGDGTDAFVRRVLEALLLSRAEWRRRALMETLILADWDMLEGVYGKLCTTKKKGTYLESLVALLLQTAVPGWKVTRNKKSETEEFDLIVSNEVGDGFFGKQGVFIPVECKNWSKPLQPDVLAWFRSKAESRPHHCTLGLFVSLGPVTRGFRHHIRPPSGRRDLPIIILLERKHVEEMVFSTNRGEWLKDHINKQIS